jgi:hypothetical protein
MRRKAITALALATCYIVGQREFILEKRSKAQLTESVRPRDQASAAGAKPTIDEMRFAEIIEAVVDELKPYQRLKKDVQDVVPRLIKLILRQADHSQRRLEGTPAATLKHLKQVRETAANLEKLLLTMPSRVAWVAELRKGTVGFKDELGLVSSALVEQPGFKLRAFISDLEQLQTASKLAERYRGPSPLYESKKGLSAKYACFLIVALSKNPPTLAPSGPLLTIAGLIFEFITGEQGANLERHCKAALRRLRP